MTIIAVFYEDLNQIDEFLWGLNSYTKVLEIFLFFKLKNVFITISCALNIFIIYKYV